VKAWFKFLLAYRDEFRNETVFKCEFLEKSASSTIQEKRGFHNKIENTDERNFFQNFKANETLLKEL